MQPAAMHWGLAHTHTHGKINLTVETSGRGTRGNCEGAAASVAAALFSGLLAPQNGVSDCY